METATRAAASTAIALVLTVSAVHAAGPPYDLAQTDTRAPVDPISSSSTTATADATTGELFASTSVNHPPTPPGSVAAGQAWAEGVVVKQVDLTALPPGDHAAVITITVPATGPRAPVVAQTIAGSSEVELFVAIVHGGLCSAHRCFDGNVTYLRTRTVACAAALSCSGTGPGTATILAPMVGPPTTVAWVVTGLTAAVDARVGSGMASGGATVDDISIVAI